MCIMYKITLVSDLKGDPGTTRHAVKLLHHVNGLKSTGFLAIFSSCVFSKAAHIKTNISLRLKKSILFFKAFT